ncbi:TPR-like protein [Sistotremastrum suecicum HHB10207 ss-3]|uniref:TPR-like protein n=1 Tax=Sistotremastrum suecicum HHB10207 ss-3 TaxID=1314776 RepID=A0A166FFM5_9AGAM|nr:TPR-like protein [Sistotremastrum suecicum HHB10207 ss-3]
MSLQAMISGDECAAPSNPLHRILKHADDDRSLQRDRMGGPSSSRLQHLPSSIMASSSQADMAMARQFFQSPVIGSPVPRPMDARPEIPLQPMAVASWSLPQQNQKPGFQMQPDSMQSSGWSSEFHSTSHTPEMHQAIAEHMNASGSSLQQPMAPGFQFQQRSYGMGMYSVPGPSLSQASSLPIFSDADFDAAFASFDQLHKPASGASIREVDDNLQELNDAMGSATLSDNTKGKGKAKMPDVEDPDYLDRFERVWNEYQTSNDPNAAQALRDWEADFNERMGNEREEFDYGGEMEKMWNGYEEDGGLALDSPTFDQWGAPMLSPYEFERQNPYLEAPPQEPLLERAKALLAQNGSLSEAARMIEAAIQRGDLGAGGFEAWILLGETRSMDEREDAAMRALREGVRIAEAAGAKGEGMVSLAISYTNESYEKASYHLLLRWLGLQYPSVTPPDISPSASTWVLQERATEAFLAVARQQNSTGVIDPDIQIGLGILSYTNGDFDRAKDCFEAALSVRPRDYLLWNRLGSCLSNGNRPEEALGAYREALNIRPTYTRAIYNVGVACLNIGAHREAAEHFLSGIAAQQSTGGPSSDQLWTTLKRCFTAMERPDLVDKANPGVDLHVFRNEGFDF